MVTKNLVLALVLVCSVLINPDAASADTVVLEGKMSLWTAEPCEDSNGLCSSPKLLQSPWAVRIEFERPKGIGLFIVTDRSFTAGEFNIRLLQLWRTAPKASDSYLMTQISLSKPGIGVMAVCSRYDAHDSFGFIPPGACAGRDGKWMVGVSLSRD